MFWEIWEMARGGTALCAQIGRCAEGWVEREDLEGLEGGGRYERWPCPTSIRRTKEVEVIVVLCVQGLGRCVWLLDAQKLGKKGTRQKTRTLTSLQSNFRQ